MQRMRRLFHSAHMLLAAVGMLGLSLRLWMALKHPPTGDELGQSLVAGGAMTVLFEGVAGHLSPPLSYLVTWLLYQILQSSDVFLMRLPSIVFGTMAVLAQYWLTLVFTKSWRVSLLAALLVALSGYLIYHSAENRMYAQYLLAAQLVLICYVKYAERRAKRWYLGLLVSSVSLVYLHYFAWLLLGGMVVHSILLQRHALLGMLGVSLVAGLLLLPWLVYALGSQIGMTGQGLSIHYGVDNPINIPPAILHLLANGIHDSRPRSLPFGLPVALSTAAACACLISLGLWQVVRTNQTHTFLVILVWAFPLLVIIAWTALVGPIFILKYLMFVVPVWYLLLGLGLCRVGQQVPCRWGGWVLSVAVLISLPGLANSLS